MECANKYLDIYDKLNNQPHLQEIIRNYYYDDILNEQARHAKFHVLDTLNYAFNLCKNTSKTNLWLDRR